MTDRSAIAWTDATWNPVTGCDKASPGCDNCYALTMARRLQAMGQPRYQLDGDPRTSGPGFGVSCHEDVLSQPLRWRKPRMIFVCSMSDLFHPKVPAEHIAKVWSVMAATPWHVYQVLTKRSARMRSLLNSAEFTAEVRREVERRSTSTTSAVLDLRRCPLPNVWIGVTVEDQERAEQRIPDLLETPADVLWVSAEPLLGAVDLTSVDGVNVLDPNDTGHENGLCWQPGPAVDWVVGGGESGPKARPIHPAWARSLRDQCLAAGTAFFFKQWGAWAPWVGHPEGEEGPGDTFVNPDGQTGHVWYSEHLGYPTNVAGPWCPESHIMHRVGSRLAGRLLDGRTWDQYPEVAR